MMGLIFLKITTEETNVREYFLACLLEMGYLLTLRQTKERCGCVGISIRGNRVVLRIALEEGKIRSGVIHRQGYRSA